MANPAKTRRHVALLIETSNSYARGLLQGIHAYVHENPHWTTYLSEQSRGDAPPAWFRNWRGDGIIARVENERIASAVARFDLPTVDVSAARAIASIPCVETDDDAIARLAVEHFVERDFKSFAYCGDSRFIWSKLRAAAMRRHLAAMGLTCLEFDTQFAGGREKLLRDETRLVNWLKGMPAPTGILACYDIRARQILELCRLHDIAVPERISVLGIDDDELMCRLSDPPLSSVVPDTHRTGYLAAQMLDRMFCGEGVSRDPILVKPLGIATRQSTDLLAIDDPEIASALRFIREHACDGINVQDVLQHIPVSRRILDNRFKKMLGRTPHDEILRVQLRRVEQLLKASDLSIADIADRAGFAHTEYLSVVFKQKYGVPPTDFRLEHRGRL